MHRIFTIIRTNQNRSIEYQEGKIEEYLEKLDQQDGSSHEPEDKKVMDKLDQAKERMKYYLEEEAEVRSSKDGLVSTTDPDARAVIKHRNIVEVGTILYRPWWMGSTIW